MFDFLTKGKLFNFNPTELIQNIIIAVLILVICWFISLLIKRTIKKAHDNFSRFDAVLLPTITSGVAFFIYSIGVIVILDIFGVNTNSIIAIVGAAGIGIALALKDTLQNIAAGIMLLFIRPFTVGDFIECGSTQGVIKEVHIFTTVLETPDGLFISAPNSALWGNPIKNYTRNGKRRLDAVVGISYGDSIETGIAVLNEIIANEPRFLAEPAPVVMVQTLGDSSINLQIRAWLTVGDFWNVSWHLNHILKEKIEAAGLSIPFPQRDIHVYQHQTS